MPISDQSFDEPAAHDTDIGASCGDACHDLIHREPDKDQFGGIGEEIQTSILKLAPCGLKAAKGHLVDCGNCLACRIGQRCYASVGAGKDEAAKVARIAAVALLNAARGNHAHRMLGA